MSQRRVYFLIKMNSEAGENEVLGVYGTYARALRAAKDELGQGAWHKDGWVYQAGEDEDAPKDVYLSIETRWVR